MDIKTLDSAVKTYQTKNDNNLPTNLQAILPYLNNNSDPNALNDPWGKPYSYTTSESNGVEMAVIQTTAKDGTVINNLQIKNH